MQLIQNNVTKLIESSTVAVATFMVAFDGFGLAQHIVLCFALVSAPSECLLFCVCLRAQSSCATLELLTGGSKSTHKTL